MTPLASHPILTCADAQRLEARLLGGDEAREWPAMQLAGRALARAICRDSAEIGGLRPAGRLLALVGKGHNGGDALIATQALLEQFPAAQAEVLFAFGSRALRPLATRAWQELVQAAAGRLAVVREISGPYEVCLDGVFGFQFRPPVEAAIAALLAQANAATVRLRAAVDLPSAGLFRADFTYATGSVKQPVLGVPEAGRVRYLDLGFFRGDEPGDDRVLLAAVLARLSCWRPPAGDKRDHGHVFIIGGSGQYPGAVLMAVLAALQSGVGLVTAFVPETLAPAYAARAPEAMWVGWPQTPEGGLALAGEHLLGARLGRASALVLGPGLGREPETLALAASIARQSPVPFVLDADALQPDIVQAGTAPRIATPHAGELARIGGRAALRPGLTLVEKGPVTRVAAGSHVYHALCGGPVLSRGGSGDLLAGLIGGLLAQTPTDPVFAAARGVMWHGLAADLLARERGQVAVRVTDLLDFLPAALRLAAEPAAAATLSPSPAA